MARCAGASVVGSDRQRVIMATIFSVAQIEHFKREAKQLCRTNSNFTHSAALDLIASRHGYPNWSVLHKHSVGNGTSILTAVTPSVTPPYLFDRTREEMARAIRKLPENRDRYPSRADEALTLTEDICDKFASAENSVDFAVAYMASLLTMPRFRIYSASRANWEMRCWLPYCVHSADDYDDSGVKGQILVNRRYKPVGQTSKQRVKYGAYTNLHLKLSESERKALTPYGCSTGYLFNDGTAPWHSRSNAERYLTRLQALQAMLRD